MSPVTPTRDALKNDSVGDVEVDNHVEGAALLSQQAQVRRQSSKTYLLAKNLVDQLALLHRARKPVQDPALNV